MQLHRLGNTSLNVTRLGLGLAALGRPGYINLGHAADLAGNYDVAAMEQRCHAVLDAAWQAGLRYFDAARSYGRAEQFLGNWLRARGLSPAEAGVGSKWGYTYTADWQPRADVHEVKEHSLAVLQRQWAESRAELGNHLRLYQIHSATLESGVLDNTEVLNQLARIRRQGVAIGLSVSGKNQAATLARVAGIIVDGLPLFDTVQVTWNLLEPSTTPVLRDLHAAGFGVIVKEALANGRLTANNQRPADQAWLAVLQAEADRLACSLDALALAAVLAQPWADVVLSGAGTVEQFQSNATALQVAFDEQAATALAALAERPDVYWSTRSDLEWN
jgi:aryl-alcohol dehydrogenase-like predicted oxidoreductase